MSKWVIAVARPKSRMFENKIPLTFSSEEDARMAMSLLSGNPFEVVEVPGDKGEENGK